MLPIADEYYWHHKRQRPYITISLIGLNVIVFWLTFFSPEFETIALSYGVNPSSFSVGQLISSQFLHGSFSHIIFNMWSLWLFGDNIELKLGHFPYLGLYLISGVVGGLVFLLTNAGGATPAIGASGAIAGVLGAYLLLFPRNRVVVITQFGQTGTLPAIYYIGLWFLLQLVLFAGGGDQGIAFSAHIGGFLTGALTARLVQR